MRISELATASGIPLATVKFYLREGLLPAGSRTAANQAQYGPDHVARLRLIRALREVAGLSLAHVRAVLDGLEHADLFDAVGITLGAALPAQEEDVDTSQVQALVEDLGWSVRADSPPLTDLSVALDTLRDVGLEMSQADLRRYATAAASVAEADVRGVPTDSTADAVTHVILGTLLREPVLLALRRLAHESAAAQLWSEPDSR